MSGSSKKRERRLRAMSTQAPCGPFFHGGAPGLQPGQWLLTFNDQRRLNATTLHHRQRGYDHGTTDRDLVYFSTDIEVARTFAAELRFADAETGVLFERGSVYEVEPIGRIFPDTDFPSHATDSAGREAGSRGARGARIVRVVDEQVHLDTHAAVERVGRFTTWSDGSPIFQPDSTLIVTPRMLNAGFQVETLGRCCRSGCPSSSWKLR